MFHFWSFDSVSPSCMSVLTLEPYSSFVVNFEIRLWKFSNLFLLFLNYFGHFKGFEFPYTAWYFLKGKSLLGTQWGSCKCVDQCGGNFLSWQYWVLQSLDLIIFPFFWIVFNFSQQSLVALHTRILYLLFIIFWCCCEGNTFLSDVLRFLTASIQEYNSIF